MGFIRSPSTTCFLGRPRWEPRITFAPFSARNLTVGHAALSRVASVTTGGESLDNGALRSTCFVRGRTRPRCGKRTALKGAREGQAGERLRAVGGEITSRRRPFHDVYSVHGVFRPMYCTAEHEALNMKQASGKLDVRTAKFSNRYYKTFQQAAYSYL